MRKMKLKNISQSFDVLKSLSAVIIKESHIMMFETFKCQVNASMGNPSTIGSLISDDQQNTDKYMH